MVSITPRKLAAISVFVVTVVAIVTYIPALKIGFYVADGWELLGKAATMPFPNYMLRFLDPASVTAGYRPVQAAYIYLLYLLFGFNADGYHTAQSLIHATNAILLFLIILRLAKRWRLAVVATLFYVVLPAYSRAVFMYAVIDPLTGLFYLFTILLWIMYLDSAKQLYAAVAFGTFVLALLSKEVAIFLPLFMFLIEWWFFGRKPNLRVHVWRYAPFVAALFPYLWLVLQVQSHGESTIQFGYRLGPHMVNNLFPYLVVVAFPWTMDLPAYSGYYLWFVFVVLVSLAFILYKRSTAMLFLWLFAVLNILPLTAFPIEYFNTRYLYLSIVASAIFLALGVEAGWRSVRKYRVGSLILAVLVVLVLFGSEVKVAEAATGWAEYTRQVRIPFRDISRQHPAFPSDTTLYFIDSPTASVRDFEGLFFMRYGADVDVNSTETGRAANLRSHDAAFVYYFDPTGRPIEVPVEKPVTTRTAPALPVRFENLLTLEQYEVPSDTIQRGKALIVFLNWRASGKIEKDLAVFVHLVDAKGNQIAGFDSQPQNGKTPTSTWDPHRLMVDVMVVPINPDAPVGDNYRLEIGLYDLVTGKRLSLLDANDQPIGDMLVIEPFNLVP